MGRRDCEIKYPAPARLELISFFSTYPWLPFSWPQKASGVSHDQTDVKTTVRFQMLKSKQKACCSPFTTRILPVSRDCQSNPHYSGAKGLTGSCRIVQRAKRGFACCSRSWSTKTNPDNAALNSSRCCVPIAVATIDARVAE
jgi:hypothetical protein